MVAYLGVRTVRYGIHTAKYGLGTSISFAIDEMGKKPRGGGRAGVKNPVRGVPGVRGKKIRAGAKNRGGGSLPLKMGY